MKSLPFNADVGDLFRLRSLSSLFLNDDNLLIGELIGDFGLGGNTAFGFALDEIGIEPNMLGDAGLSLML